MRRIPLAAKTCEAAIGWSQAVACRFGAESGEQNDD
jgi:hypothetical protein